MALDPATLEQIRTVFLEALQLGDEPRRLVDYQLNQLAELIPRPDTWATLGHGDEAALALLAGDVLLTITRETPTEEPGQLVVTSHRLHVTEIRHRRKNQDTVWDFRFRDRDPLRVEGRMGYPDAPDTAETFDRAEAFARALATSIGWQIDERASVAEQEPHEDELPEAGSPARRDRGRQQVTDLWGNPISKSKRGNR